MSRLNARILIFEHADEHIAALYRAIRDACRK